MQISGLGSSDGSSTSITNNTTTTNNPATTSNAATSSDFGITVALQDSGEILNETEKFTENSNGGYLFGELDTDIAYNHDLSNVQSQIDTYTSSLASSNVYQSIYSAPSASFLSDLNALKHDAATNNLSAAVTDLAKAKTDAPKYFAGAYEAGDENGVAAITVESADDVADYLQTQGATAVQAKADANAIILSSSVVLGIGASLTQAASNTTEASQITSQVTSLATAAAEQDSSTTNVTSDPLFNIVESLYKSAQVSDSSSLQTLSLLNSLYTGNGTAGAASTATDTTKSTDAVSSYA